MRYTLSIAACGLLLCACTTSREVPLSQHLRNPLYAYGYHQDHLDHLVNLAINDDPLLKDPAMKKVVDRAREDAIAASHEAAELRKRGVGGDFIRATELVTGHALVLDQTLFFGPDFATPPGIDLHVYLSSTLDPRDGTFPLPGDADLGSVQTYLGDQEYDGSAAQGIEPLRSVVLYDTHLKRVYAFAQIKKEL